MSMDVWYEIIIRELAEQDRMRELLRDAEEVMTEDAAQDERAAAGLKDPS